ncbi:MAG TPA: ferric reductase-like transmembrane domain-containing protein [Solirubrobacteraceae bacterium]
MTGTGAGVYVWWLVSRASGIVALALVSLAVLAGLTMATRLLSSGGIRRKLLRLHEHLALVALAMIVIHGGSLLLDPWLRPGLRGVVVPFAGSYRPLATGMGIIAGYLAGLFGLSFYARKRIGARMWRRLHRATVVVWVLGVLHTLGAGSDASATWLRAIVWASAVPIFYLMALRLLQSHKKRKAIDRTGDSDGTQGDGRPVRVRSAGRLRGARA